MKLKKFLCAVLACAMILSTMGTVFVSAEGTVAKIGDATFPTIQSAVDAAQKGEVVNIVAETSDEAVSVDRSLTITGDVTLENVSINAVDGCGTLTVSGLSFAGNSWINSGMASKLVVSGVTADVAPVNTSYTNSRSAFISLGRSEGHELELVVENSSIEVSGDRVNHILGWAAITKAVLSGNTFGSEEKPQNNCDAVKFMANAADAEFVIRNNVVYSNYNGIVFSQNVTRGNAYTVSMNNNTFIGSADHVWLEVSGSNTIHAKLNATSDNTVNGNAFTKDDFKVHPNISTWTGYAGVDVVYNGDGEIISGTFTAASNVQDYLADEASYDAETGVVVSSGAYVAKIGNRMYATLEDAVAGAVDGDVITLLTDVKTEGYTVNGINLTFDLNENTFYLADTDQNGTTRINHKNNAVVTYTNGTINVDEADDSVAFFGTSVYDDSAATMIFDGVVFEGENYDSGYAVFYLDNNPDSVLKILNSKVYLTGEQAAAGGVIKSEIIGATVIIENSEFILDDVKRGFVNSTTTITDSDITFKNMNKTALRNFNGTISGTNILVDGAEYGVENDGADRIVTVQSSENRPSNIKIINTIEEGILLSGANTSLTVTDDGSLLVVDDAIGNVSGNVISKANTIVVDFVNVESEDYEPNALWNIVLKGANAETINRLNSADLTFKLSNTEGKNDYEIIEYNEEIAINNVNNLKDRFEFHYEGKTGVNTDTATDIVIGQVKINGYGTYSFVVDADANSTNAVHATTINDNIVDTFVPNGALNLNLGTGIQATITAPTRSLTITIDFPNAVQNNPLAYQNMQVVVSGEDLAPVTVDLGTDNAGDAITADNRPEAAYTVAFEDGKYVVIFNKALTVNTSYDIVVSGLGYRTARYTVTMTDDKTVNFWNNVKDAAADVEAGKFQAKKNFLAGDIVKDNNINVYDLSAVVSYFGETGLSENNYPQYAKYDLNRDGFIDSKDVAMVLVSWNE